MPDTLNGSTNDDIEFFDSEPVERESIERDPGRDKEPPVRDSKPQQSDGPTKRSADVDPFRFEFVAESTSSRGTADSGTGPARRGRKPGSRNRTPEERAAGTEAAKSQRDIINLETIFVSFSELMAGVFKYEDFTIESDEAKKLNACVREYNRYHNHVVDPKRLSEINLFLCVLTIIGLRLWTYYKDQAEKQEKKQPATVTPIRPATPSPQPSTAQPSTSTPPRPAAQATALAHRLLTPQEIWPEPPNDSYSL